MKVLTMERRWSYGQERKVLAHGSIELGPEVDLSRERVHLKPNMVEAPAGGNVAVEVREGVWLEFWVSEWGSVQLLDSPPSWAKEEGGLSAST